jgi:2-haloacid dehalogenase
MDWDEPEWHRFRALTFDCYGTLIDWETGIVEVLRPWAERHGIAADDGGLLAAFGEIEARCEGEHPRWLYADILRTVGMDIGGRWGLPGDPALGEAVAHSIERWPAFPDSAGALARLARRYKMVIVSNVDRTGFAHSRPKLGITFDAVVTAEDVGSYKPDPAHFHEAFRQLAAQGVPRDQILHVAQSLYHDHVPAKALGMTTVWINRRAGKEGWGATLPPGTAVKPDAQFATLAAFAAAAA